MSFDRQRAEEILAKHNNRKATATTSRPAQARAATKQASTGKIDVAALVEAGRLAGLAEGRQRAQAILNTREAQANPLKALQVLARVEIPNVKPAKFAALFADGMTGKLDSTNRSKSAPSSELDNARCNELTAAIGRLSERRTNEARQARAAWGAVYDDLNANGGR